MDSDIGALLREGEKLSAAGKINIIDSGAGLSWGTDAWLLASFVRPAARICELGCGTGVISFLLAAYGKSGFTLAAELRRESADAASRGVKLNRLDGLVKVVNRDIRTLKHTDDDIGGRFGAVVANPPYISHPGTRSSDTVADDARHENHGGIDDFCAAAARLLNYRGSFYCVFRPGRLPDLFAAMRESSIEPKRMMMIYPDTRSAPTLVLTEGLLGGAPGLEALPPFFIFEVPDGSGRRTMTEKAASVYETLSFSDIKKAGGNGNAGDA
ncbi:MAG: methyltransferase [Clostridia bacterium]|nr:methyltransferase [Clostridia bacterium]